MLQCFKSVSDHFGTLCIKGLKSFRSGMLKKIFNINCYLFQQWSAYIDSGPEASHFLNQLHKILLITFYF